MKDLQMNRYDANSRSLQTAAACIIWKNCSLIMKASM